MDREIDYRLRERPEVGKPTSRFCKDVTYGRTCGGPVLHWQSTFNGESYWVTQCRECGVVT